MLRQALCSGIPCSNSHLKIFPFATLYTNLGEYLSPNNTFLFNNTWCWSRGSKHANPAKWNDANSILPPAENSKSLSFRNSQPSGCKEEGVRDPQPCTAPTANLPASCLVLTEWGWGREIPHINSHHQSYRRREKNRSHLQDLRAPLSYSTEKTKTHTHIHTRSKGKRDPTCNFIPLSCSLRATWTWAVQGGSIQKVWLQTAEQQPWLVMCVLHLLGTFPSEWSQSATEIFSPPLTSVKPE